MGRRGRHTWTRCTLAMSSVSSSPPSTGDLHRQVGTSAPAQGGAAPSTQPRAWSLGDRSALRSGTPAAHLGAGGEGAGALGGGYSHRPKYLSARRSVSSTVIACKVRALARIRSKDLIDGKCAMSVAHLDCIVVRLELCILIEGRTAG